MLSERDGGIWRCEGEVRILETGWDREDKEDREGQTVSFWKNRVAAPCRR